MGWGSIKFFRVWVIVEILRVISEDRSECRQPTALIARPRSCNPSPELSTGDGFAIRGKGGAKRRDFIDYSGKPKWLVHFG